MENIIINGIQNSATVAGREYQRTVRMWVESARRQPLTRGGLVLPDPMGEEMQRIAKGDPVALLMGYRGAAMWTWNAEVTWVKESGEHKVEMGLVAVADAPLARTRLTQAWMHETPEAILRHALGTAGIAVGRLDPPGCELPRFAVSDESIWQIGEKLEMTCARAFKIDMDKWSLWVDGQGMAHWGDFDGPDQSTIPGAVSGGNLLRHKPATDAASLGEVETFLLPGLLHSHQVRIQDVYRGVNEVVRAQKVRHEVSGDKARTHVWYGPERKRY